MVQVSRYWTIKLSHKTQHNLSGLLIFHCNILLVSAIPAGNTESIAWATTKIEYPVDRGIIPEIALHTVVVVVICLFDQFFPKSCEYPWIIDILG